MTKFNTTQVNKESAGPFGSHSPAAWIYGTVSLLLFALLFRPAYEQLLFEWTWDDYNFCYFVPLIVGYLVWERRGELRATPASTSWAPLAPLCLGITLYFLGEFGGEYYVMFIGSWLVLVGFLWFHLGWGRLLRVGFPVLFLISMFPFPAFINNNLTLKLKLISSQLGVFLMQGYGLSAYREGNVIDLGFTKLQVVDACSGLRYFFPLIILSLLLAYYYRGKWWQRALLVLSSIPISVVTNGMRIASVGILYQYLGPMVAEGFFHDFSGWFIFMVSLGLLVLELRLLKKVFPESPRGAALPDGAGPGGGLQASTPVAGIKLPHAKFAVCALLMVCAIVASHRVEVREKVPVARPFAQFPLRVAYWQGSKTVMEKEFLDALNFDDYTMIDYRDRQGKTVSFYTAYYGSQTKGGAIHSPASCLPGGGWVFEESGSSSFPLGGGGDPVRVSRACMQKNGVRELTYYWFPQRGRVLTSLFQLKLYTFWNALTSRRTDGALVRVITPVYESERLADAEQRLQGFTREITPVLAQFIPN